MNLINIILKLFLLSGLFVGLLALVHSHVACVPNTIKNDTNFDLSAGEITRPDGVADWVKALK